MAPETAAGLAHCQRAAGAPESDALVPHAPQGQHCLSGVGNVPRVANKNPAAQYSIVCRTATRAMPARPHARAALAPRQAVDKLAGELRFFIRR